MHIHTSIHTHIHTYIQIPARTAQGLASVFSKLQDSRALPQVDRKFRRIAQENSMSASPSPMASAAAKLSASSLFRTVSDPMRAKACMRTDFDLSVHTHFGAGTDQDPKSVSFDEAT